MKRILIISFIILFATNYSIGQVARSTSTKEAEEKLIKLYPNPAVAYVMFDIQKDISKGYSIQIYNFLGKKMIETQNIIQKTTVLLDEFNRGVYIYHLRDQNGKIIESGKFQVSK